MKKLYTSLAALLLSVSMAFAQTPANRTSNTIIADVLAQMPAGNGQNFNSLMSDLASTGADGVRSLVSMLKAQGQGDNANVRYAISGLSAFVSSQDASQRSRLAEAYIQSLGSLADNDSKAFVISQLQTVGGNESVDALATLLTDAALCGPASRALAVIGTDEAARALTAVLPSASAEAQKHIIDAIGEARVSSAEPALLALVGQGKPNQKEVLYALGRAGSTASLAALSRAAAAAGFTTESTGANEAYISLLKHLASAGGDAASTVLKNARKLYKDAAKAGAVHTREAAEQIILSLLNPDEAAKEIVRAMKDTDKDYRNAVLLNASGIAGQSLYVELLKTAVKAKDAAVTVDILNFLTLEARSGDAKKEQIRTSELKWDEPTMQVLHGLVSNADGDVVRSDIWLLNALADKSSVPVLARLLSSGDELTATAAHDALATFSGSINADVARVIPQASDRGKIAGIDLLAARKATANLGTVLQQTESSSADVKTAAYSALKELVSPQDFTKMCGMLEETGDAYVPYMQQAVTATLAGQDGDTQVRTVMQRMNQAGPKASLYYAVLAATAQPRALQAITDGVGSTNASIGNAAFQALLQWPDNRAAEPLYDICRTGDSRFSQALDRYIELSSSSELTGENRLIQLREAMEVARTDQQRNVILKKIGDTGTFLAMIYAAQFIDTPALQQTAAKAAMDIAVAHKEYNGTNTRQILGKVLDVLNIQDSDYLKQSIRKYLSEVPEDEDGFVSIFNGRDLTGWKGLVEDPITRSKMKPAQMAKAQVKANEQMTKDWIVEDGSLVYVGTGFDNLCTQKQYADFEMYVDWRLDPNGEEPDAGIYLRGAPQVQIWDTARVDVGAQVGSGGLYNNKVNRSTPLTVADNKLGQWNTFYIRMVGDRVTVRLNGVLVTDDIIMENYWDRSRPIFPIEQLELQAHGSRAYFRNIYVRELKSAEPYQLSAEEKKDGFRILFDGTNMYQWTGNTVDYTIEDGCISMNPSKAFGGNLYTKDEFSDFVFRFDFQLTPGANNGVGIRTPMEGDAAYVGMEIQVLDCEHPIYSDITPLQHHGSVYGIIPALPDHHSAFHPAGEWNTEEIYAKGDHIRVTVNGQVILDGDIREATRNGTADHKEHPGLFNKSGHIGFLGHGSPVKFRNIRIKELK